MTDTPDILAAIERAEGDVAAAAEHECRPLTRDGGCDCKFAGPVWATRQRLAALGEPSVALARALVSFLCMEECCKDTPSRDALAAWAQAGARCARQRGTW
jgi:hypothetical protein